MALTGSETLQVLGQNPAGKPAAATQTTTTSAIASLSSSGSSSTVITSLNTVGAGTITAAGIFGKFTTRGGTQIAAFTDTTDTAANIIAALPNATIGNAFQYSYINNTTFPATISGGVGVTITGPTVIQANSWERFLVTYSSAGAITMVGVETGNYITNGTFVLTGTTPVTVNNANVTAGSNIDMTLKTAGGTVGDTPSVKTITPQTGFTVVGTALDTSTFNYSIVG